MALTPKQKHFVDQVDHGHSHSQAYRAAYSSLGTSRTVAVEAYRLMQTPKIAEAIKRNTDRVRLQKLSSRLKVMHTKRR